jgi:hypothetical protein
MSVLTRRVANIISILIFFIIFMVGYFSYDKIEIIDLLQIAIKACVGALIFWIIGFILSDIALKAILETIQVEEDNKWTGGLFTRVVEEKEKELKPSVKDEEKILEKKTEKKPAAKEEKKTAVKSPIEAMAKMKGPRSKE